MGGTYTARGSGPRDGSGRPLQGGLRDIKTKSAENYLTECDIKKLTMKLLIKLKCWHYFKIVFIIFKNVFAFINDIIICSIIDFFYHGLYTVHYGTQFR